MTYYPFPNRRSIRLILGAFFCAVLFLARDSLYDNLIIGFTLSQFLTVGLTAALGIWFLAVNRGRCKEIFWDRRLLLAAVAGVLILLPMLWKRDWQLMYFSIFFAVVLGVFVSYFLTCGEAAKYYVTILSALAVYSVLAAYLLRIPADRGIWKMPVAVSSAEVEFYWLGFSFVPLTFVKYRNFGIFREPGVYQYFLILGLYLNNYQITWDSPKKLWAVNIILAVTTVTTFATGGLVELALLAAVLFFDKGWYRKKTGKCLAGAILLLGALAVTYIVLEKGALYATLLDMLSKFRFDSESMSDRAGSIAMNTKLFFSRPIFGAGIRETLYAIANNTSSSTILYAILGIFGGSLNAAGWLCLVWRKGQKKWVSLALTVILFMSFNTENLITEPYFWLFPVMALAQWGLPAVRGLRRLGKE